MGVGRLKEKGRIFREAFLAKLGLLLRGTVAAPPDRYGETLADEHIRGGGFAASAPVCDCFAISWPIDKLPVRLRKMPGTTAVSKMGAGVLNQLNARGLHQMHAGKQRRVYVCNACTRRGL